MSNPEENRIQEILSAYLDDELTPAERAAVDGKLQSNPALKTQLESLRLLRKTLVMEGIPAPPATLAEKIKNRLPPGTSTAPRLRKRRRFNYLPLAAAATVTVGVIAGAIYLDQQGRLRELFQHVAVKDQGTAPVSKKAPEPTVDDAVRDRLKSLGYVGTPSSPEGTVVQVPSPPPAQAPGAPQEEMAAGSGQPGVPGEKPSAPAYSPGIPARGVALETAPKEKGAADRESEAALLQTPDHQAAAPESKAAETASGAEQAMNRVEFSKAGFRTWTPPGTGMLNWSVAPPEDPAKVLGGLAEQFGGKGWLVPGPPRAVRINVPREQWPAFLAALRSRGVAGTINLPDVPEGVEQVTLVVAAPSLPGAPGR